ncbi:alpha/beta hydrolase [Devosia sp. CAU 1758]
MPAAISRRSMLIAAVAAPALVVAAQANGLAPEAPDPVASPGRIVHWRDVQSDHVGPRDVTIWLPQHMDGPLPVIYAHDGENLFDSTVSVDEWPLELDRAMGELAETGVGPAIVVGIWATAEREREYNASSMVSDMPSHIREAVELSIAGETMSDAYLRFIVEELKPRVDAEFNTLPDRQHTFTFGVSMGGLIAVEAMATHPDVFGGAVAMSAHLFMMGAAAGSPDFPMPADAMPEIEAAVARMAQRIPAEGHRLWLDHGTIDLDQYYAGSHKALAEALIASGWDPTKNLEARIYVGTGHHGRWWIPRVKDALGFLLRSDA